MTDEADATRADIRSHAKDQIRNAFATLYEAFYLAGINLDLTSEGDCNDAQTIGHVRIVTKSGIRLWELTLDFDGFSFIRGQYDVDGLRAVGLDQCADAVEAAREERAA